MRVLLAIDDSPCSQAAARAVAGQFRPEATEVRVVNVVEWPKDLPASLAFTPGPMAAGPTMELEEEIGRRAEELVDVVVEQLRAAGFTATGAMREGDARHVILEYAEEWRPDVIVLGSHGRTGLDRLLLGSVSENVVRHAPCSVEVVRGAAAPASSVIASP
jgi:nucleotide-binding universal stress UspA family protein